MNWSNDITMYFDLGTRIEVDEKPEPDICCFQIIEQLGSVSGMQSFDGLEFEDNLIEANDVGHIETTVPPFIEDVKRWLGDKGNVPLFQFLFERVLIDLFKVARTECRVDFVDCTSDGKCLFLENVVAHGSNYSKCSEPSVCSVAETVRLAFFTTEHTERAAPDTEHTEDFWKARGSTSVYSVCREAASVCSVAKNGWHGGRVLPQNTQNGLRPTQNTQKIFGKHGVRLQCIQCAAGGGFSVCAVV